MVNNEDKLKVSHLPEFKNIEILDTWFEDIDKLRDEIKDMQKHLRKVQSERKKQPSISTISAITREEGITYAGYQIIISTKNKVIFSKDWC